MAKGNVAAEPSMEEILASIRRIIADEDPGQAAKKDTFIAEPLPDDADEAGRQRQVHKIDDVLDLGAAEQEAASIPARPVAPIDMDDLSFGATEAAKPAPAAMSAPAPAARQMQKQNDWSEPMNQSAPKQSAPPPPPPQPQAYTPPQQNYASPGGLTSAHTGAAVNAAFNSLASAIFSNEPRTIEDLTKEMLRPLLKQWLDDNLPSLVERIVRDEIERVARGR